MAGSVDRTPSSRRLSVTSRHVAKLAGVSQSTVSRALAGDRRITPATRELVERTAREAGYVPDALGRSLAKRSTASVGIVASDLTNPYYPHLLSPVTAELEKAGYRPVLYMAREDEGDLFASMGNGSIDGAVLTTSSVNSRLPRLLAQRGIPFVLINRDVDDIDTDRCLVDNRAGARELAVRLFELGHRQFACLAGPLEYSTGRDRERGFGEGLVACGLRFDPALIIRGGFSYESGFSSMLSLLDSGLQVSAVFCANDVIALGAFDAAVQRDVRVPEQLTLVGFDDIPMAAWQVFQLSTVRQDTEQMGRIGVRLLLDRIGDPDREPRDVRLVPRLVLRGTHGPPPARTASWLAR